MNLSVRNTEPPSPMGTLNSPVVLASELALISQVPPTEQTIAPGERSEPGVMAVVIRALGESLLPSRALSSGIPQPGARFAQPRLPSDASGLDLFPCCADF